MTASNVEINHGAKVIKVIETKLLKRGAGIDKADPIRIITQYWSLDGELLAETDPFIKAAVQKPNFL